jgi:dTDP-4-dehydrorhamnose reductase
MILLLGASGYVGRGFVRALRERGCEFTTLSRLELDYSRFDTLLGILRAAKPEFVINAAGYTGKPNVDACENERAATLCGNTLLPQTIAHACLAAGIPWGHVSSGCIYSGAKVVENGCEKIEPDLNKPSWRAVLELHPEAIRGFTESDVPNFSFRHPPCSFYSGTKALAEEAIAGIGSSYLWRLRIPFDEFDHPRNFLSKLQSYPRAYDNVNSLSHRLDYARACLDLWSRRAPFGIYNVTNPGFLTTRQVVAKLEKFLKPKRRFEFWKDDEEFYRLAAKTPRSNCILDTSRLLSTGVKMRPVEESIEDALRNWRKEP